MENVVVLSLKEFSNNEYANAGTILNSKSENDQGCNISIHSENDKFWASEDGLANITIPGAEAQPGCLTVSPCGNYVAAINRDNNELMVYSLQVGTGVIAPPFFKSTLNLDINDRDHRDIMGWDKEALGQYRTLDKNENAFLRKASSPHPDPETISIAWSRFETLEQTYICINAYTKELKRFLALFNITKQRLDSSWHEIAIGHKLGHAIAWRPRCNQVAVTFQSDAAHHIGIWERGALVRGIQLGITKIPVKRLEFSEDGTGLLVWQQTDDYQEDVYVSMYLYANGGWMRKQQLYTVEQLREVKWSCPIEESALKTFTVQIVNQSGGESCIQWGLRPDVSTDGEVVLIAGQFINITSMKKEVLPPGTCSLQIELPLPSTSANQIFLHKKKPIVAVLCDRFYLHFYDRQTGATLFSKTVNIKDINCYSNIFGEWLEGAQMDDYDGASRECEHFRLRNTNFEQIVVCVQLDCTKEQCLKGRVEPSLIASDIKKHNLEEIRRYRQVCNMELDGTAFTCTLDFNEHLYINEVLLSKEISSVCLDCGYLFVTSYKTLYYFGMTNENIATVIQKCRVEFGINGPPSTEAFARYNLSFIYNRPIEVQAKLLTGSVGGLVLVIPRGNLELIQISEIGGHTVTKLMAERNFKEAVHLVHLQNLDPNVLIDSDIEGFITNAVEFVNEVQNQSLIHLLVSLTDNLPSVSNGASKRSRICLALRDALLPRNGTFQPSRLPILALTSLQATSPSSPMEAMMDINSFLKMALKNNMEESMIRSVVDNTLRALQAASGKEMKWFEHALRLTHEQQLAKIVADVLRMDPRVYEPLLQELNKYKGAKCLYQHHVYKYLGEDEKAMLVLLEWHKQRSNQMEDTEMVLEFIQDKHLHRRTMDLLINAVPTTEQESVNINTLIAPLIPKVTNELLATHDRICIRYAAALFERVGQHYSAMDIYAAHNIQQNTTVSVTTLTPVTLMNPEEVISVLVNDGQYLAALSVAKATQRKDLIDTVIGEGITERAEGLSVQIREVVDRFTRMNDRLNQVRLEHAERILELRHHIDDEESNEVFDDTASMATTAISTSVSTPTNVSSNRRRQRRAARKADKLREGHARENINLVRILYEDILWAFNLTQVMTEFYEINIAYPLIIGQDARFLIKTTLQLQQEMTAKSKVIWPEEINFHLDPVNPGLSEAQIKHIVALQHNWNYLEVMYRVQPANMKNTLKTINSKKW